MAFLLPLGGGSMFEFFKYSRNLKSLESDTLKKNSDLYRDP